ncbi:MAG: sulfur carrier protein ThiS [Opitutaceae bacterium]|nr:sulfur carrier protein ThiS [Cytophagales bacterium]
MDIYFNGDLTNISENLKLESFLHLHQLDDKKGLAVAVNNQVIPKKSWDEYILTDNDKVLVIKASQGG